MARQKASGETPADPFRRRILTGAPLAGAAAVAAARGDAGEAAEDAAPAGPRDLVYRETEHVRAYYARARE